MPTTFTQPVEVHISESSLTRWLESKNASFEGHDADGFRMYKVKGTVVKFKSSERRDTQWVEMNGMYDNTDLWEDLERNASRPIEF